MSADLDKAIRAVEELVCGGIEASDTAAIQYRRNHTRHILKTALRSLAEPSAEVIEAMARAMEPSAFETYGRGHTVRNYIAERAFLNAKATVERARKKARAAHAALFKHLLGEG